MGDLGDLSDFFKEGRLSNLDWLDIDEEKYRAGEYPAQGALPRQNLDTTPDLEALWSHEDRPSTAYFVPNKELVRPYPGAGPVHTVGDLSEMHGRLRSQGDDIARVTRYAMMQSTKPEDIRRQLVARFDRVTLEANKTVIASVLTERGLLGKLYIAAADFPECRRVSKASTAFVRRHALDAKFVLAKPECSDCTHAKHVGNGTLCSVFYKQIVPEVPYTEQLAEEVERTQQVFGKNLASSHGLPAKDRIRLAFLAKKPSKPTPVYAGVGENQLPKASTLSSAQVQEKLIAASSLVRKQGSLLAKPILKFIRQGLLEGRRSSDLATTLKASFSSEELDKTASEWSPLLQEAGLYGSIYSTQDSFDDCAEGADFLAKHASGVRAIVAGSKCQSCIYNKIGRCLLYGRPLVKAAEDLYTWPTVEAVLLEHKNAGRISPWEKTASADPRQALKDIHTLIHRKSGLPQTSGLGERMDVFHQWVGSAPVHVAGGQVKKNILRTARRHLNEGLYGQDLLHSMKSKFEVRDLTAARNELKTVLAEQGLQGIYYVDPSVYDDYGRGCEEASRLFRAKQVPYVKLGTKCGSCVHNLDQRCGKLAKKLVVEPPYLDKTAQQQAILSSGPASEVSLSSLMAPSGLSMITEFQLQNPMEVEFKTAVSQPPVEVVIGRTRIKV